MVLDRHVKTIRRSRRPAAPVPDADAKKCSRRTSRTSSPTSATPDVMIGASAPRSSRPGASIREHSAHEADFGHGERRRDGTPAAAYDALGANGPFEFLVLPASVWVEVEAAAEVDRRLEVLPVAKAAGSVPDPLNLRVQALGGGVAFTATAQGLTTMLPFVTSGCEQGVS